MKAQLDALNSKLCPAGCHAKFGTIFRGSKFVADWRHEELWLSVATTPEEVSALRREPAFWSLRPHDYFTQQDGLTMEELLQRTKTDPMIPVVAAPPWDPYADNCRCRNKTRIV